MRRIRLKLPKRINSIRSVYETGICTADLSDYKEAIIDSSSCEFFDPFPLVYLAFKIRELQKSYPNTKWLSEGYRSRFGTYADRVGFFDFLNIETFSLSAGSAKRSHSLIPIEVWSIPQLKDEADKEPVGALVDSRSRELASVLLQKDTGQVYETLQYAIREISRNAIEHSQGEIAVIMAQYWPKNNRAEIVVADDGIGIAENLYYNEYVDVSNNIGALKVALMPGVSGVSRLDRGKQDSVWRNSGFGLYVVSRLAARFGRFCIISNGDYLELSRRRQVHRPYPLSGTAVSLNIQMDEASDATFYIKNLIEEGEKTRTAIINSHPILASEASKMLLSDFGKLKE